MEHITEDYCDKELTGLLKGYAEGDDNRKDAIETLLKDVKYQLSLQQKQESVAERFARIVRGNLIGIDKEVQQKFEQLYFEVTGNKMYGGYKD